MSESEQASDFRIGPIQNGLDFILEGVRRLTVPTPSLWDLKHALISLSCGVEVILKERLCREHWSLVFADPGGADKSRFESGDFCSVGWQACIDRLHAIAEVEIGDAHRRVLSSLSNRRNRLVHRGIVDNQRAALSTCSKALCFFIEFVANQFDSEAFGESEAQQLLEVRSAIAEFDKLVGDRWNEIRGEVDNAVTAVVMCPACLQVAAIIDLGIACRFCGHTMEAEAAARQYVEDVLGASEYATVKDGGVFPLYRCPSCWGKPWWTAGTPRSGTKSATCAIAAA